MGTCHLPFAIRPLPFALFVGNRYPIKISHGCYWPSHHVCATVQRMHAATAATDVNLQKLDLATRTKRGTDKAGQPFHGSSKYLDKTNAKCEINLTTVASVEKFPTCNNREREHTRRHKATLCSISCALHGASREAAHSKLVRNSFECTHIM